MEFVHIDSSLSIALFLAILGARELGRWLGRRAGREGPGGDDGTGAIEAAVFGMFGLLVAFTFGSAMSRFDDRQGLIVEEANAIGTAWAVLDLLPAEDQPALRDRMRRYVDARLAAHRLVPDWETAKREIATADALGEEIWSAAVVSLTQRGMGADKPTTPVVQALSEMSDVATKRKAALSRHQPFVVFVLLVVFAIASALTSGYAGSHRPARNWFHAILFAAVTAIAFFVILDLEHPRQGLLRLDRADQVLIDLRASMEPTTR